MRRLQHGQLVVAQEPAHGELQKTAGGHVVAIEDGHKWRVDALERVVDVARLGILVAVARHVSDACFLSKGTEVFPPAVVEDVDVELVGGPVDVHCGERGEAHHAQRLVEGGDQQVHRGPLFGVVGERHRRAPQGPQHLEIAEEKDHESVALREQKQADEPRIEGAPVRGRIVEKRNDGGDAPVTVAEGRADRQEHQSERDLVRLGSAIDPDGDEERQRRKDELMFPVEIKHTDEAKEESPAGENCESECAQKPGISGFKLPPQRRAGHGSPRTALRTSAVAGGETLLSHEAISR